MLPGRLEGLAPEEAPSLWIAGLQALLICGVAMLGLHLLGKHKSSFRSGWF